MATVSIRNVKKSFGETEVVRRNEATTASNLGLGEEAVGSEVRIGGIPFVIVGILQPKGGAGYHVRTSRSNSPFASSSIVGASTGLATNR